MLKKLTVGFALVVPKLIVAVLFGAAVGFDAVAPEVR
jgi:hypothetical protein